MYRSMDTQDSIAAGLRMDRKDRWDNPDNAIVALFSASHVCDLPNFNKVTFLTFAVTVNCVENRQLSAFQ